MFPGNANAMGGKTMFNPQSFGGKGAAAAPGVKAEGGATTSGGGKVRGFQALRPVSIKQLMEAQRVGDGAIIVDGREVTQVTLVGRVIEIESAQQSSAARNVSLFITDGSGVLSVRHWLDANDEIDASIQVGALVRVNGTVKIMNDKPQVTGTIRFASDDNEMTFHMLDIIQTHLRITRGAGAKGSSTERGATHGAIPAAPGPSTPAVGGVESAILHYITHSPARDMGVSVTDLVNHLGTAHGVDAVRTTIRAMAKDGVIFQTVDDSHYGC